MGVREKLNNNPGITMLLAAIIMVGAVAYIAMAFLGHRNSPPKLPTQAFYTDDDGVSYYPDKSSNIPPYDHAGKQAVRAIVFKCSDGKPFVQRLEQYNPETKVKIEEAIRSGTPAVEAQFRYSSRGMMVKKPGDKDWAELKQNSGDSLRAFAKVMEVRCPNGSANDPHPVAVDDQP